MKENGENIIGIVGGVGPYAGLDLMKKILEQTAVSPGILVDQEHLTVINYSGPGQVVDRTQFLTGKTAVNPAIALFEQLMALERAGASVAGIPCNTAHALPIFSVVEEMMDASGTDLKLLNMISSLSRHLHKHQPEIKRLGLLGTIGTYWAKAYEIMMEPDGFDVIVPDEELQTAVHAAIQDPEFGIKAWGYGTDTACSMLMEAIDNLQTKGIDAVILGCTELPLALVEPFIKGTPTIDPTLILARALIREAHPEKLREWRVGK